jgi:hypothetical protein
MKRIEAGILADLKPVTPLAPPAVFFCALIVILAALAAGAAVLGIAGWQALDLTQLTGNLQRPDSGRGAAGLPGGQADRAGKQASVVPLLVRSRGMGIDGRRVRHPVSAAKRIRVRCDRADMPQDRTRVRHSRRGVVLAAAAARGSPEPGADRGHGGRTGRPGRANVLEIFCPNPDACHILVWHLAAAVANALGGVALGIVAEYSARRALRRTS